MDRIGIKGLYVVATHGVNPEEKVKPQPFVLDVELRKDFTDAAIADDLSKTVNYAKVCSLIMEIVTKNSYNLIEKLAYECAFAIAEKYPVKSVAVVVHKPEAPVAAKFRDISVTAEVVREKVYLSLGSSEGEKKATLDAAIEKLKVVRGVSVTKVSSFMETEPYGGVAQNGFLNCAVELDCLLSPDKLLVKIHEIEDAAGRVREKRWADRTLDIDIVFFGNRVIAQEGLIVPHPDYMNRDFVLKPLAEIAPEWVCPLERKRIADMAAKF